MGLIGRELRASLFGDQDIYGDAGQPDGAYPHTNLTEDLVRRVLTERRPNFWLEVGSMLGGSALLVARVAAEIGLDVDVVCVDPFTGDVNMWVWEQDLIRQGKWRFLGLVNGCPTIRQRFLANVREAGFEGVVTPIPVTGIVGMRLIGRVSSARPQVVYVDSAHEEHETFLELATAWDLLEEGGVLMGDDFDWDAVRLDVLKFANSVGRSVEIVGRQWLVGK